MAYNKIKMALAMLLVSMSWWHNAMAQSSDCSSAIISMSSCLNYIQGNSSTPSSGCCSQLSNVVRSQPQCLCQVLNGGGSSLGLNINQTQALELPKACKVQTPPVSQCNGGNAAAPPPKSPAAKTPASPNTVPAGRGSNAVPSTDTNSSDAIAMKMAAAPLILLMASYLSTFIFSF